MARVIAKETGIAPDGVLQPEGAFFEVPDDRLNSKGQPADGSTWYEAAEQGAAKVEARQPKPGARPAGAGPIPGSRVPK